MGGAKGEVVMGTLNHPMVAVIFTLLAIALVGCSSGDGGSDENPASGPNLTEDDVVKLTYASLSAGEQLSFPAGMIEGRCVRAEYRSSNGVWVVTCEFFESKADIRRNFPNLTAAYIVDDETGKVSPP
jgi:hypothetical protein